MSGSPLGAADAFLHLEANGAEAKRSPDRRSGGRLHPWFEPPAAARATQWLISRPFAPPFLAPKAIPGLKHFSWRHDFRISAAAGGANVLITDAHHEECLTAKWWFADHKSIKAKIVTAGVHSSAWDGYVFFNLFFCKTEKSHFRNVQHLLD